MESAWQQLLNRLSWTDPEFTYDDVCGWSADEFKALNSGGLIFETTQATRVDCDACQEAHSEQVQSSEDGKRAFIACPAVGTVDINLERLRRWRGNPRQFAVGLAKALVLSGEVKPIPATRLWVLGRRRTAARTPYFFFGAIPPEDVLSAAKEIRDAYGRVTGALLVPFTPVDCPEEGKLRIIDVGLAVSLSSNEVTADIEFIEEQFLDGPRSLRPSQGKKPGRALIAHRRRILKAAITDKGLDDMNALARHLGASETALHGMVRGDKTRYADNTLSSVLKKLECSPAKWNRVSTSQRRQ